MHKKILGGTSQPKIWGKIREPLLAYPEDQTPVENLANKVRAIGPGLAVFDFFAFLRASWLEKNMDSQTRAYLQNAGAGIPECNFISDILRKFRKLAETEGLDWGDFKFHVKYRAHTFEGLATIMGKDVVKGSEDFKDRYLFSMLPLNLLLPAEARMKFVPPADYFALHVSRELDPYGIWMKGALILDKEGKFLPKGKDGEPAYLASRKFKDVILMNITENCPIGCSGCYKSPLTRERDGEIASQFKLTLDTNRMLQQIKGVVEWLNRHPEVNGIVLSGGEPLMYPNKVIGKMLEELKQAKHLQVVRICTGTIFQGLPSRIDDELLGMLRKFTDKTGKRVAFNAHISNHHQLTPEALVAARRIKKMGFEILLQMPIQAGINFFAKGASDEEGTRKTVEYFAKLGTIANAAGLRNYKWIMDMSPRTQERVVPIELLAEIVNRAFEMHQYSDMTKPNDIELLCRQGNFYIGKHLISSATAKIVERELGTVAYFITPDGKSTVLHREPLIPGVNDSEKNKYDPDYAELFEKAKKDYTEHLKPIEKRMKEVAADITIPAETRNAKFRELQKEFLAAHDIYFPPVVEVETD